MVQHIDKSRSKDHCVSHYDPTTVTPHWEHSRLLFMACHLKNKHTISEVETEQRVQMNMYTPHQPTKKDNCFLWLRRGTFQTVRYGRYNRSEFSEEKKRSVSHSARTDMMVSPEAAGSLDSSLSSSEGNTPSVSALVICSWPDSVTETSFRTEQLTKQDPSAGGPNIHGHEYL